MKTRDLCWLPNTRSVGRLKLTLSAAEIISFKVGSVLPEVLIKSWAVVGVLVDELPGLSAFCEANDRVVDSEIRLL